MVTGKHKTRTASGWVVSAWDIEYLCPTSPVSVIHGQSRSENVEATLKDHICPTTLIVGG